MKRAIFCISFDTELLWGRHDLDYAPFIKRAQKERQIIKNLLEKLKKYNIPVTWAIVGKMFEQPKQNFVNNDLWYGADIIQLIKSYKIHEIASHSYSHPVFTELSRKEAREELINCQKISGESGFAFKSFVYPRNKIKYLDLLEKFKYKAYRGHSEPSNKLILLIKFLLFAPNSVKISKYGRLVNIPGNYYFLSARGIRKFIPSNFRYFKAKLGIDNAIKDKQLFHLWTHPGDFADQTEILMADFDKILKYVSLKRKEGLIDTKTMITISNEF